MDSGYFGLLDMLYSRMRNVFVRCLEQLETAHHTR